MKQILKKEAISSEETFIPKHCVLFCKTLAQTSVVHQKKSFPKSISCYTMPLLKGLKSYLAKHCGREVHQIVLNLPNISDVL